MAQLTQVTADALGWVRTELTSSLERIGELVEHYLEDPQDKLPLQRAFSEISQVHGTLRMMQCFGAAIVADETRQVLHDLVEGNIETTGEAFDSVLDAVVQLSDYLDLLSRGGTDSVLIFQPLINALRVARGSLVMGEADLFVRQSAEQRPQADLPDLGGRDGGAALIAAKRFHPVFQAALLQWLRGQDVELNLRRLGKIAEQLHGLTIDAHVYELWWLYAAAIEGVLFGGIGATAPIKRLSGQMARTLKDLARADDEAAVEVPHQLCCRLLYHIQRSTSNGRRESAVREAYSLAGLLPDEAALADARQRLRGLNGDLIGKLSAALKEDLAAVRDSIDLLVRAGNQAPGDMDELMSLCTRISNTLAMLGLNQLQRRLLDQMETLDAIRGRDGVDPDEWVAVARALIEIDQRLDGALKRQLHGETGGAGDEPDDVPLDARTGATRVARESLVNIARVKESLRSFVGSGGREHIRNCERWLREIEGGLSILDQPEGVRLFRRLRQTLAQAAPRLQGEPMLTEQLADVVAALEWYLEALGGAHSRDAADPAFATRYLDRFEAVLDELPGDRPPIDESVGEATMAAADPTPVDVDPEVRDVFLEEAAEVQTELERLVPDWVAQPDDHDRLADIRRAFHTLKGGGGTVGATTVGEFNRAVEHMLNLCLDGSLQVSPPVVAAVGEAVALLPGLVESFRLQRAVDPRVSALIEAVNAIASAYAPETDTGGGAAEPSAALLQIFREETDTRLRVLEEFLTDGAGHPDINAVTRALHTVAGSAGVAGAGAISKVAGALEEYCHSLTAAGSDVSGQARAVIRLWLDYVRQALSELDTKGAIDSDPGPLLGRIDELHQSLPLADGGDGAGQESIRIFTEQALDRLEACENHVDAWYGAPDERHHPEAMAEVMDGLTADAMSAGVQSFADVCRAVAGRLRSNLGDPGPTDPALIRTLHQVLDDLFDLLDRVRLRERVDDVSAILELLGPGTGTERQAETGVPAAGGAVAAAREGAKAGDVTVQLPDRDATDQEAPPPPQDELDRPLSEPAQQPLDHAPAVPDTGPERDVVPVAGQAAEPAATDVRDESDIDPELRAIFTEEAGELLEAMDHAVSAWQGNPVQTEPRSELQRLLHTLKGSARMARLSRIGDVSHELETYVAAIEQHDEALSPQSVAVVRHAADAMHAMVERVTVCKPLERADELIAMLEAARAAVARGQVPDIDELRRMATQSAPAGSGEEGEGIPAAAVQSVAVTAGARIPGQGDPGFGHDADADEENAAGAPAADDHTEPVPAAADAGAGENDRWAEQLFWRPREDDPGTWHQVSGETARVPVESLDNMLNEGGEISIFRSRLEQENTAFRYQLGEMGQTIARIAERVRLLNLETETSMLSRHQGGGTDGTVAEDLYGDEFDPLELDRYTRVQELSRALSEGLNDLFSLHGLMEQSVRETDSLLTQQARVNTALQQRLMRALMVPFSHQVGRLDRVVRQTATEYGRNATLRVHGESQELDRNVLQRMIAPLEHLLRNAVVHGIEPPEARARSGKPERGSIDLRLWRDGSQLVIELGDDGRGLDLEAIRRKAESRGMLTPGQPMSDEALANLIFERGFTTADRLTQSAGRGVGMDVVNAEIRQVGGAMRISSAVGEGARFEIRLPLSLAISHTLLVRAGEETYAVPLRSIEGVTRVDRASVKTLFANADATINYGDRDYAVGYLGDLVGLPRPDPDSLPGHVSLLLVRAGEQRIAVAVDAAIGGREVVVKPVGPQISTVPGVNGATILADGQVVLILDVAALLADRERLAGDTAGRITAADHHVDTRPLVLVVDDSITVRRVSERLLARSGYRVALARDGMDALAKLQVESPDIVLLDIEMPRIDGFEVATYIRKTEHLREVPIIMLTSRSGDKHRQRASQIGVNGYLIKPYREEALLSEIRTLIHRAPAVAESV